MAEFFASVGNPCPFPLSDLVSVIPLTLLCLHSLDRVPAIPLKPEMLPGDFPRVARHFFGQLDSFRL